jgi:DNA-binding transcriptional LysR family regulator
MAGHATLASAMSGLLPHADKLHALRMVGQCASLREAAAQLGIAPSSLSEKLRTLETALGTALIARSRGRVALSPFAHELLETAGPALDTLLALSGKHARGDAPAVLRVGAYESLAVHILPEVLTSLGRQYPATRLELRSARSAQLARGVLVGELDCAVVVGPVNADGIHASQLFREHLGVFYTKTVTAARAAQLMTQGEWAGLAPDRGELPNFYRDFCKKSGFLGLPQLSSDSFEALRELACDADLPVVLPQLVARASKRQLHELQTPANCRAAGAHDIQLLRRRNLGSPLITRLAALIKNARE